MKRNLWIAAACFWIAAPVWSAADGPPITNNNYKVDLAQTVVTGSARKIAMGGAYAAIPGGASSLTDNLASVSVRPSSATKLADWDATFNTMYLTGNDVDNNGSNQGDYRKYHVYTLGLLGQLERFGAGLVFVDQQLDLNQPGSTDRLNFLSGELVFGANHFDGQLAWGIGIRSVEAKLTPAGQSSPTLFDISGGGGSAGVLWRPGNGPWRFGGVYKGPIKKDRQLVIGSSVPMTVNGLIVPEEVTLPLEGTVGVSYEQASAPFWPGHAFVVSTDIRFIGAVRDAVGLDSMARQIVQTSGSHTTPIWHLGAELEPWPTWVRVRAGTYREPSRFDAVAARQHLTGGFQLRLLTLHFFGDHPLSFNYAFDVAPRYLNNAFSFNFWKF